MSAPAVPLAFLNLGPTELVLILLLFLILFGAEQLPVMARSLARFQVKVQSMFRDFQQQVESKEEREFREQVAFERMREEQIRQTRPEVQEELALKDAAAALGIPTEGRSVADIRADIAARVGAAKEAPGGGGDAAPPS